MQACCTWPVQEDSSLRSHAVQMQQLQGQISALVQLLTGTLTVNRAMLGWQQHSAVTAHGIFCLAMQQLLQLDEAVRSAQQHPQVCFTYAGSASIGGRACELSALL